MTQSAPLPPNEQERLAALHALNLLDTSSEERFDHITHLAKTIFAVPIVLISLVDAKRQWFKSCYGLSVQETPREQSFCAYTLLDNLPLIVSNTLEDLRFADHPSVLGEPSFAFTQDIPCMIPRATSLVPCALLIASRVNFSPTILRSLLSLH